MKPYLIKFCGNKSLQDLMITAESKADYIGVIFAESKRKINTIDLKEWLRIVNLQGKKLVGVFVNAELSEIMDAVSEVPLSIIQCHGTESVETVQHIKEHTKLPVWKVIHHSEDAITIMQEYKGTADGYVIDSKVKGMWGGSGESFDWSFIPKYVEEARHQQVPCLIAGGINPQNLEALLKYNLDGIDLSSGIEVDNIKNKELITIIEERVKVK